MRKLILASLTISSSVAAQTPAARPRTAPLKGSLEQRLAQLIDAPPFNRATWGIYVVDDRGRVLYQRNADRFSVPASNTKLAAKAAGAATTSQVMQASNEERPAERGYSPPPRSNTTKNTQPGRSNTRPTTNGARSS